MPRTVVDCRQPSTDAVRKPPIESEKSWVELGPLWAIEVLETLTKERGYRKVEHECYLQEVKR